MPKWKFEQSVDEWLSEGVVTAETNRALAEASNHKELTSTSPTAGASQETVRTGPRTEEGRAGVTPLHVTGLSAEGAATSTLTLQAEVATGVVRPTGDVAVSQEDATACIWSLLAQAGYECW